MRRYLYLAIIFFILALAIAVVAFGQDDMDAFTPPPPPSCDVTVTPIMVPGVLHMSCGLVPSPCTCTITFPQGQTSTGLQIVPDSDVTVNIVGGGQ